MPTCTLFPALSQTFWVWVLFWKSALLNITKLRYMSHCDSGPKIIMQYIKAHFSRFGLKKLVTMAQNYTFHQTWLLATCFGQMQLLKAWHTSWILGKLQSDTLHFRTCVFLLWLLDYLCVLYFWRSDTLHSEDSRTAENCANLHSLNQWRQLKITLIIGYTASEWS